MQSGRRQIGRPAGIFVEFVFHTLGAGTDDWREWGRPAERSPEQLGFDRQDQTGLDCGVPERPPTR